MSRHTQHHTQPDALPADLRRRSPTLPPVEDATGVSLSQTVGVVAALLVLASTVAWFAAPLIG